MERQEFKIGMATAAKIGSVLVHVEEALGPGGHVHDLDAVRGLLGDDEVQHFLDSLRALSLVPVKRTVR